MREPVRDKGRLEHMQKAIQNHQKMGMGVSSKEKGGFLPRNHPFPYD